MQEIIARAKGVHEDRIDAFTETMETGLTAALLQVQLLIVLGAAGGLVSFLVSLRLDHYKNNRYLKKSGIEIVGGAITATCLVYVIRENQYVYLYAFLIGTAWSYIIQRLRSK